MIPQGKDFDRGVNAFEILEEALSARLYLDFLKRRSHKNSLHTKLTQLLVDLDTATAENDRQRTKSALEQLNELYATDLNELIEKFREEGTVSSTTFHSWDQLLVDILMPFKVYIVLLKQPFYTLTVHCKSHKLYCCKSHKLYIPSICQ